MLLTSALRCATHTMCPLSVVSCTTQTCDRLDSQSNRLLYCHMGLAIVFFNIIVSDSLDTKYMCCLLSSWQRGLLVITDGEADDDVNMTGNSSYVENDDDELLYDNEEWQQSCWTVCVIIHLRFLFTLHAICTCTSIVRPLQKCSTKFLCCPRSSHRTLKKKVSFDSSWTHSTNS